MSRPSRRDATQWKRATNGTSADHRNAGSTFSNCSPPSGSWTRPPIAVRPGLSRSTTYHTPGHAPHTRAAPGSCDPFPAARAQLRQPSREFAEAVHLAVRDGETIAHLAHENVTDRSRHDPPTARHAAPSAQHVLGSTAMGRYEQRYGVLAEGPMDGWQDQPEAAEISAEEFERLWTEARRALGGSA
ncbi:hypothetical protein [Streptomyces sp. NBC_01445]|uniref:hypothetical protein n=1 Tax=Streptomyces sp. NBC_01445 TaxID=2903869 RepID=UPI002DD82594|nr:hypothetical protein [Streptomyces sp. NBC_01445]WSE09863.1 hypothetical protein OG574_44885 [Streptomyces sp. NBC_01445]